MESIPHILFQSECGKGKIFLENSMGLGACHDFLMQYKGIIVERMVKAHKDQEEEVKQQENLDENNS